MSTIVGNDARGARVLAGGRVAYYFALLTALLLVHLRLVDYPFDDAYIHVRIADHLVQHGVPYFNTDEPVMASSSSLWTLILAAMFAVLGTDLTYVAITNAVLVTGCVWVYATSLAQSIADSRPSLRHDVIATGILVPLLAASSIGAMETPLALLICGIGILLFQRGRPAAFALLAIAAFVRVELAALFLVFGAAALRARRPRLLRAAAWTLASALPLVAYDLYFFRTIVPHAVQAKALGYSLTLGESLTRALAFWPLNLPVLVGVLAAVAFIGLALLLHARSDWAAKSAFSSGALILLAYAVTRAMVFEWYVPLYTVLLVWPLVVVACGTTLSTTWRAVSVTLVASIVIPAQVGLFGFVLGAAVNPALAPAFAQGARVQSYIAVGRALFRVLPDETLLTSEVGGLGYGFQGRIDDAFGLISPAALRFHPMRVPEERARGSIGAIPPDYVREERPALIVSYRLFAEALLRSEVADGYVRVQLPLFCPRDAAFSEAANVPTDLWGLQTLNVLVRQDLYRRQVADALDTTCTGDAIP